MDLIVEYINSLEINKALSFNTLRLYRRDLLDFDKFLEEKFYSSGNAFQIADLSPKIIEKYIKWLETRSNSTAGVNRKLTALHGFWLWLEEGSLVSRDPFTQITRASQFRNTEQNYLKPEEVERLLNPELHDLKTCIMLELIYGTGIRVSELVSLTLADIDLDAQLVSIPGSSRFRERVVPFNALLKEYLMKHIEKEDLKTNQSLFRNRFGEKISEREVFRRVREAKKKAGINSKVNPSVIRNSFLKHLKERGAYKRFLQDITGQKNC
jgi:integrase/recombinase XerD